MRAVLLISDDNWYFYNQTSITKYVLVNYGRDVHNLFRCPIRIFSDIWSHENTILRKKVELMSRFVLYILIYVLVSELSRLQLWLINVSNFKPCQSAPSLLSRKINKFSIGIIMQPLHIYVPKRMFQISMNNHASYTSLLN